VPLIVLVVGSVALASVRVEPQTLASSLKWLLGGVPLLTLSVLASAVFTGEYTSFVASFGIFFVGTVTVQFTRLSKPWTAPYLFTVQEVMSGIRPTTLPIALLLSLISVALLTVAIIYSDQKDF